MRRPFAWLSFKMIAQHPQRLFGDDFAADITGFNGDISHSIDWIALSHQPLHHPARIGIAQKRTVLILRYPRHQYVEASLQPDRDSVFADRIARQCIHESAAAGRDDGWPLAQQPLNNPLLQRPELRLAITREKLG